MAERALSRERRTLIPGNLRVFTLALSSQAGRCGDGQYISLATRGPKMNVSFNKEIYNLRSRKVQNQDSSKEESLKLKVEIKKQREEHQNDEENGTTIQNQSLLPNLSDTLEEPDVSCSESHYSPPSSYNTSFSSNSSDFYGKRITKPTLYSKSLVDVVEEAKATNSSPTTSVNRAQRKKWTYEMNSFIWRTYLYTTNMETNTKQYLDTLHKKFSAEFPNMKVSKQRLGDQRRAILRNKLLPTKDLEQIKSEVQNALNSYEKTSDENIPPNVCRNMTINGKQPINVKMRWSSELNEKLIKSYFEVTDLETNLTAYRKRTRCKFIEYCPELSHLSEQRLADQRRSIIKNKLISDERLHEIRREIRNKFLQASYETNNCNSKSPTTGSSVESTSVLNLQLLPDKSQLRILEPTTSQPRCSDAPRSSTNRSDSFELGRDNLSLNKDNVLEPNTENTKLGSLITQAMVEVDKEELVDLNNDEKQKIQQIYSKAYQIYAACDPVNRPYIPKQKCAKKLTAIVNFINLKILPEYLNCESDFETIHTAIYCAVYTASQVNGTKFLNENSSRREIKSLPAWQRRLQDKIDDLRKKIGRLTQYMSGNRSKKVTKEVQIIINKYQTHSRYEHVNSDLLHFLDTLKQKLSSTANRLKRYTQCTRRKQQNTKFYYNEKAFYRNLAESSEELTSTSSTIPTPEDFRVFWSDIWSKPVRHTNNKWIENDTEKLSNLPQMAYDNIDLELFRAVIANTHNWKAAGSDHIHNFWYKKLTYTHKLLLDHINKYIESPETLPTFITQGITYMLPKDKKDSTTPEKFRPITCLQTIYKIITACIKEKIYKFSFDNNILAEEQKGCRKKSQGCKEQLTIDAIVSKQAFINKRNIYTMYIDYKKAYDSIPHSWLVFILEHYKIHPTLVRFLKHLMDHWQTAIKLKCNNTYTYSDLINIKRGLFQGDSLSPLWFCLALNPLSNILNYSKMGYKIKYDDTYYILSHLMYMDDIKLFGSSLNDIYKLADLTQSFSNDIHMKFGLDKCKIQSVRRGHVESNNYQLNDFQIIGPVDQNEGYKYLGYQQSQQIHHRVTKSTLTRQFKMRLHKILNTQLNSRNTIKAINTFAIPVLNYSFGIIKWSQTDLRKLQRIINTTMTKYRKHHPRSCVQRQTLPKREGGRGLIDIQNLHNKQIISLRAFFHLRSQESSLHKAMVKADKKFTPLNLSETNVELTEKTNQEKVQIWQQKSLHGRHRLDLMDSNVDKQASNAWLKRGELFPETEGFMLAIQDQVIETKNYRKHIIKEINLQDDKCRRCQSSSETIQHIIGACKAIAQTDYKHRHDQVASIIHQSLAYYHKLIKHRVAYYKYIPEVILESANFRLYWDRTIITDKTVHYNRPDLTLFDKSNKSVYLIDIAIPNTHNLSQTYTEKITKYFDLTMEIKSQWHAKDVKVVPIVISATGVVPKSLHNSLKLLQLHSSIYVELQKAVILNTCRIVRKFLSYDR